MYQYPGGLVAFAIVLLSILTAWAMNYTNPKIRVFGTILAAIGCFAVAVWFLSFVATSGILENPKPNQNHTLFSSVHSTVLVLMCLCTAVCTG